MMKQLYESFSPEETFEIGRKIGKDAAAGEVFCLSGDLGVGKTLFSKGFAAGLNIMEPVNSPTFTIVQEYSGGRVPFYHFDVYRLTDIEEMEEIGHEEYFYGNGITLIEWAELIEELLPDKRIKVLIEKVLDRGFDYRKITVEMPENFREV